MSNYSFNKNHFIIHFRQKNNKLFIRLSRGPLQEILYLCYFLTEQAMSNFELSDQLRKSAWEKDTSDTLPPIQQLLSQSRPPPASPVQLFSGHK